MSDMPSEVWVFPLGNAEISVGNDINFAYQEKPECKESTKYVRSDLVPAVDLKMVLDDYKNEIKALPFGYVDKTLGDSVYNHRMAVIREIRKRVEAAEGK